MMYDAKDTRITELEQQVANLEEYVLKGVAFRDELQAVKEKAEGALRSVAGAVGEFADADGKNIVEKIEFLRRDWEERDEVWREKKRVLENDLGKAWEENKLLREELRTGLAMTACPACGSETANTNESRLNLENKRLREALEWACEVADDTARLLKDEPPYEGHKASWRFLSSELRRRSEG